MIISVAQPRFAWKNRIRFNIQFPVWKTIKFMRIVDIVTTVAV